MKSLYDFNNLQGKLLLLTLLHTEYIPMTKYQSSHQCLHGLDNPIALLLGKALNNAQMPIPTEQIRLSSSNLL